MREAELAERLAERRRERPRAERGCPSPETLLADGAGALADDAREALLVHVERCPDCAAELALAGELRAWADEVVPVSAVAGAPPPRPARSAPGRRPPPSAPRRWLPLAAALVVAVVGGVVGVRRLDLGDDRARGVERASWPAIPADGATLAAPPDELTWSPVDGAGAYRVELYDAAFTPLVRSAELDRPRLELPEDVALRRGETYFWRILVRREPRGIGRPVGSGGLDDERSPLMSFRIEPRSEP